MYWSTRRLSFSNLGESLYINQVFTFLSTAGVTTVVGELDFWQSFISAATVGKFHMPTGFTFNPIIKINAGFYL